MMDDWYQRKEIAGDWGPGMTFDLLVQQPS